MAKRTQRKAPATPAQIHELKITLERSKPPIWRRVALASDTPLSELHEVIQAVMGWTNSHLHQFVVPSPKPSPKKFREVRDQGDILGLLRSIGPDRTFSAPEFNLDDAEDENAATLQDVAPALKRRFIYVYDFGDGWNHKVEVVKIGPPRAGVKYPVCLAGKLACPPDDSGGIWGYYNMLDAIKDPGHKDHKEIVEWIGEFDPERFNIDQVNEALA